MAVWTAREGDQGALGELRGEAVDALKVLLEEMGARLEVDDEYRDQYGLDFVLTRIRGVHAHVNLGVRVVLDGDRDRERDEAYMRGVRRGVVHRSLVLEMDPKIVRTGGLSVARVACFGYLFDRSYSEYKSIGLKVFEDCSYDFFDPDEVYEPVVVAGRESEEQDVTGNLIAYFPEKGFGFLESSAGTKFFFHIANVADDDLRGQLPSYMPGDVLPVLFKHGGRDGKKYPKAIGVVLDHDEYEDEEGY